jgi:hypothetical protein
MLHSKPKELDIVKNKNKEIKTLLKLIGIFFFSIEYKLISQFECCS